MWKLFSQTRYVYREEINMCLIKYILLVIQAVASDDHRVGVKHPGLMLKYSTFKNLASMAATRDDLETAMEFYLEVIKC